MQRQPRSLNRDTIVARFRSMPTYLPPTLEPEIRPRGIRRGAIVFGATVALAVAGIAALVSRRGSISQPMPESATQLRTVLVIAPERATFGKTTLPATLQPYQATDLFARVNGYLKRWKVDIGARVKAGDVLAEIDTPELDQELRQAEAVWKQGEAELKQAIAELEEAKADVTLADANVARVKAQVQFAASVAVRSDELVRQRAVAPQEHDGTVKDLEARRAEHDASKAELSRRKTSLSTRAAMIESKRATLESRAANVQRLMDLQNFQRVTAPFDGVVIRRLAEVGMLVASGSGTGTKALFSLAQDDVLRVQVAVPQAFSASIKTGDVAEVDVPEYPGRVFAAKVRRTASSVEPASRTLLVELELPNADHFLLPGIYARVKMTSRAAIAPLVVPANVLLMRNEGPFVASVDSAGRVRLHKTGLGRDMGNKVEVTSGLTGEERLIVNPTDDLHDGMQVVVGTR